MLFLVLSTVSHLRFFPVVVSFLYASCVVAVAVAITVAFLSPCLYLTCLYEMSHGQPLKTRVRCKH